jgi:hypothetical protein
MTTITTGILPKFEEREKAYARRRFQALKAA